MMFSVARSCGGCFGSVLCLKKSLFRSINALFCIWSFTVSERSGLALGRLFRELSDEVGITLYGEILKILLALQMEAHIK